MRRIFEQIRMVAKWPTTVLIRGETGTGKELIANAIHYNSPRARGAYVRLNCASLPETCSSRNSSATRRVPLPAP